MSKSIVQLADGSMGLVGLGSYIPYTWTFVVGAEGAPGANDIVVTAQLCDGASNPLAIKGIVAEINVNVDPGAVDDYVGDTVTTMTISTGYLIHTITANGQFLAATDAAGKIAATLNPGAGAANRRVNMHLWCFGLGMPKQTKLITWV